MQSKTPIGLGIFAKWPEPGFAKTRLIPQLGERGAANVAYALLMRTLVWAKALQQQHSLTQVCVWTDRGTASDWDTLLQPYDVIHRVQQGTHLGEKMAHAMQQQLQGGAKSIIVGTDTPTLDADKVLLAANYLDQNTAVFVPAFDGGYVLIGLNKFTPLPFEGIDWGTEYVAQQTRAALNRAGVLHLWCSPEPDLDTPEDYQLAVKNKWL